MGAYNSIFDPKRNRDWKYILAFKALKYTFCVIVNFRRFVVYMYYTS